MSSPPECAFNSQQTDKAGDRAK